MRLNYGFEIPQIGVGFLRQSLLILLLCGVCFACNAPQQDGKKTDLTNENKKMTNGELRDKLAFAFSGATSEEDLVVAKYGIEKMKDHIKRLTEKK